MSIIENVHANVQALLNRGPGGARGPHNAGGPHQHGGPHHGAGDRGFGGPKGGEGPSGIPRALPGPADLPGPRGVDRALPGQVPGGMERPGQGHGPSFTPGQVVQGPLDVAQGLVNSLLPAGPPAHSQAGGGHHGHGAQAGGSTGAAAPLPVLAAMQAGAAPQPAAQAAGATTAHLAVAQASNALPAQAAGAMAQQAGAPLRADVAPLQVVPSPRGGEGVPVQTAGRGDAMPAGFARADAVATAPAAPPANAAATTLAAAAAAAAAGATMATSTIAPALPAAQAADARNVPGLTVADRAQGVRAEAMTGTYTGEGPQRRRLRRGANALPASLSALLAAIGAQGNTSAAGRDARQVERELQAAAMQWLFWLLAIIAYGCVAFALVGLMPQGSGGRAAAAISGRGWSGGFAIAGLLAAGGAWWFARHLARGGGDRPLNRRGDK